MAVHDCNILEVRKQDNGVRIMFSVPTIWERKAFDIFVPNDGDDPPTKAQCKTAVETKVQTRYDRDVASAAYIAGELDGIMTVPITVNE